MPLELFQILDCCAPSLKLVGTRSYSALLYIFPTPSNATLLPFPNEKVNHEF